MTTTPPVPTTLAEALSPDWLTAALRDHIAPDNRIVAVHVVETLRTMAVKVRVALDYQRSDALAPTAVCIKGFLDSDPDAERGAPISLTESRFYADLAPHLAMRLAPCLFAGIDHEARRGILVMDDLVAAGCRFLSAIDDYGPVRTAQSLAQLARLHAHGIRIGEAGRAAYPSQMARVIESPYLPVETVQALLDGKRGEPLDPAIRNAPRLFRGLAALREREAGWPQTLLHGDAHAGNIFQGAGGVGLVDWQLVQTGAWALDVAYHIAATLPADVAAAREQDLLRGYLRDLADAGGAELAWAEAWEAYRIAPVYGYYLWSITRRVRSDITEEAVARLGAAVSRHRSFEALGV